MKPLTDMKTGGTGCGTDIADAARRREPISIADAARRQWCLAAAAGALLTQAGCISANLGGDNPASLQWALRDAAQTPTERLPSPLLGSLLLQARPSHAVADTLSIAYSRQDQAYAFYQFASWTERPVRQVPRLLQQRLQARGLAAALGQMGDPMRADWLLMVGVDEVVHAVQPGGGWARMGLTLELFDRRQRQKLALRRFEAQTAVEAESAGAAVRALSQALANCFDQALPWLEATLRDALADDAPAAAGRNLNGSGTAPQAVATPG